MIGVLAAVGRGELQAAEAGRLLTPAPAPSTAPASLAAPAAGLFLEAVRYKGDPMFGPIRPVMNIEGPP